MRDEVKEQLVGEFLHLQRLPLGVVVCLLLQLRHTARSGTAGALVGSDVDTANVCLTLEGL